MNFLRCQYRCRLVKNKDVIVAVQHFQYLRPLLHTNRDILDNGIRIYRKTIFFRQSNYFFARLLFPKQSSFCGFHSENNVVQNRKAFHKFEVLVYHTDSQGIRIVRVIYGNTFPVFVNLPLLRLIQPEKHTHQSGFSRTIFSEQRMDFPFFEL